MTSWRWVSHPVLLGPRRVREPMVAPFFLARGLVRCAYIGTDAASAVVMQLVKPVVFGAAAILTWSSVATGLVPG